jgi:hypothetical protein
MPTSAAATPAPSLDDLYDEAGYKYDVDPLRIKAHAIQETGEKANVQSADGKSWGFGQFTPETWAKVMPGVPLSARGTPAVAIDAMGKYLAQLDAANTDANGNVDVRASTAAYNGSGPAADAYAENVRGIYAKLVKNGGLKTSGQPPGPAANEDNPFQQTLKGSPTPPSTDAPDDSSPFRQTLKGGPAAEAAPAATAPPTGGLVRNAAAGLTDTAGNVVNTAVDPVGTLIGKPLATAAIFAHDALAPYLGYQRFPDDVRNMLLGDNVPQSGTRAVNAGANLLGFDPSSVTADTTSERLTRKAVGAAGSVAALGPVGLRAPLVGAAGAVTGDVAGQAAPDWARPAAELAGNVAGAAVAGPAANLLANGGRTISGTGGGVSPEVARLAQLARDQYDIPITAPQMSGSSVMKIVNDQSANLPFSGAPAAAAAQQTAWQRAVSRTMGEDAPLVTPGVMTRAATRIGSVFDNVAARTNVTVDNPMLTDLGRIEAEAARAPLGAEGQQAIRSQIDNVMEAATTGNGTLTGQAYQQLTRAGSPLQRAQQAADPNVRYYAGQVREALDSAFQRSAAPADQAALTQARGQYRAMKTIEDLVEKSPDGNLSPALLTGQVRSASSRFDGSTSGMAYTGGGALGDLARIGQQFLKTPPNSGTADRMLVNSLLGGAGAGTAFAHPLAAATVPMGLVGNRLGGAYLRSGLLANRLIDSSLRPPAHPSLTPPALLAGSIGNNALDRPRLR